MEEETIRLLRATTWTKAAVARWSGLPLSNLRLSQALSSPPFPSNREVLRQTVNDWFKQKDSNYTEIDRSQWEAAISSASTLGHVRDLCHANR